MSFEDFTIDDADDEEFRRAQAEWQAYGYGPEEAAQYVIELRIYRQLEEAVIAMIRDHGAPVSDFMEVAQAMPLEEEFTTHYLNNLQVALTQVGVIEAEQGESEALDNQKVALLSQMNRVAWVGQIVSILKADDSRAMAESLFGSKPEMQAIIAAEEGLGDQWKTALIQIVDKLLEGVSLRDIDTNAQHILILDAYMNNAVAAKLAEGVFIAKDSIRATLAGYSERQGFGFVVSFLAQTIARKVLQEKVPVAREVVHRLNDTLKAMGLGLRHPLIRQAMDDATRLVEEKSRP